MTRIKSNNIQEGGSFVVPVEDSVHSAKIQAAYSKEKEIILNAENTAKEIIEKAHAQGSEIIEGAKAQAIAEVDAIFEQARKEGFEAGREEGLQNITEELTERIMSVENFALSNFELKKAIIKSAHLDIISLIKEISHKVCSKSLELDESILTEITASAISSLKDKENITIIVNPIMAERIYAISDELRERIPQLQSIKIVEDNSVSPDGTIVESPLSRVDSRIKSQIDEISEKLMAKLDTTDVNELIEEAES